MDLDPSKLERLRTEVLGGRLNRRQVLKRATLLGLSAPVIAGLLAACGGDDNTSKATTASGGTTATTGSGATAATATKPASAAPSPTAATGAATAATGGVTPTTGSTTASPSASTGGPAATSVPGHGRGKADMLRVLYWQAPTVLNPHLAQGTKDSAAANLVMEPLIEISSAGELIPVLAAEIPSVDNGGVSSDGTSVTYKLKQDVTWSDGEPFTANDVVFTWKVIVDPTSTAVTIGTYQVIKDVTAVDDHTVKITFTSPNPGWYSVFSTGFGGPVLPEHILKDATGTAFRDAPFNLKPIGTGPYVVDDFKSGDVVTYSMNEKYRDADKPYFKKVEFKGGGDATSAAQAALQTGETDWGWNLQVQKDVLLPMAEGGVGVLNSNPGVNVEQILVNFADPTKDVDGAKSEPSTQHPFLSDKAVRQAFAAACDRDTVADQLYGPAGEATANVLVAPEKFSSKKTTYKFDTDAGAKMLEDAGWTGTPRAKGGVQMKVLYQTTVNPLRQKTQEIIKQGWEKIGVSVELKSIDASVYFDSAPGNPDTAAHFYADFEMYTTGPASPYPISYMLNWLSANPATDISQKSNNWAGGNVCRFQNADYNKLYQQATTELDDAKQVELFTGMNDIVINEVAHIPLVHRADVVGAAKKLKGYEASAWTTDFWDVANWYFEE